MSTGLVDSVYGRPDIPRQDIPEAHAPISDLSLHRDPAGAEDVRTPDPDVQWANSELLTIASTIEELQGRLQEANARLSSASKVETTEAEIGRLFVEAQQFSEHALSRLEVQVHEILCEAEEKARQILGEATAEAHEIRRQAQQSAHASTKAARELQSAIAGFTNVNSALLDELATLNTMLTPAGERREGALHPPSASNGVIRRDHANGRGTRHPDASEDG